MRVQLALNVKNLEDSIRYYSAMFNAEPHKIRDGYANFSLENPALKLVLFENPDAAENLNHIGVEVFDTDIVDQTAARFHTAGILGEVQKNSVCCHSDQNKAWSKGETDLSWEWYVINDDQPDIEQADPDSVCCADQTETRQACC